MTQRKFLVLFRSQPQQAEPAEAEPSPEQMQQMYAAFGAWKEKYKNDILDMGNKLESHGRVVRTSGVAEGPFVEAKEIVGGYMIVGAKDYDGAIRAASECPGVLRPGTSLEIRELGAH